VGDRRLDFAYPDQKIMIELDGRIDHSKKRIFEDDRKRQNDLVLAGWTVLRFTWDDVTKRPAEVARTIERALAGCTGGGT
jgi:very-short-patch-repair endonuclease